MTILFGWGPAFECHSPSPYVMKSMIQLDMLGVDYSTQIADLEEAPYKRAPYIKDEGQIIADSTFIRHYFEKKLDKDLNEGLSPRLRAQAWALERMVENDLGIMMLHERWLKPSNFNRGPVHFFDGVPEEARQSVIDSVLSDIGDRVDKHGLSRFAEPERLFLFEKAVDALSGQLGHSDFMFGDNPVGMDATVAAFVHGCATKFFDTPMIDVINKYPNLKEHSDRIDARFFNVEKWDAA